MAFEETRRGARAERRARSASTSTTWSREKKLVVDYVHVERSEIEETGEYDLEGAVRPPGLRDRLGRRQARRARHASRRCSPASRTQAILRAELRRLFRWLKDKGVTAVITGERGDGTLTRHGLEEYVSDCVILLDHRVDEQVSTRRLRIVKYRGSAHGTNEYPVPDRRERHLACCRSPRSGSTTRSRNERISTGIPRLDAMLGGKGYFRGSSVLVSGTAGTGKTSLAAHFADAACRRGERCLYFAFEESPEPDRSATCARSASTSSRGSTRACCGSTPRGRRSTASRCTWRRCTS